MTPVYAVQRTCSLADLLPGGAVTEATSPRTHYVKIYACAVLKEVGLELALLVWGAEKARPLVAAKGKQYPISRGSGHARDAEHHVRYRFDGHP